MPTLREFLKFVIEASADHGGFSEQVFSVVEQAAGKKYSGQLIYIPRANSQRDPARGAAIVAAAMRLPTGIVSERLGVSRQLISYHMKKRKGNNL